MPSTIRHITFDCRAPYDQARFWAGVLGYADDPDNPNAPDDPEALIVDPAGRGPGLLFIPVPEGKAVKNRVHLDLQPLVPRDVAVDEVLALGATLVEDHRRPDGTGWVTLADPEGNEFCVERSHAERGGGADPRDTGERETPPDVYAGDERATLLGMLEWYRTGVVQKASSMAQADARRSPVRSGTTVAGLVKHLALVEDAWFTHRFAGQPEPEPWASAPWNDDRDWEFHTANQDDLTDVVALYEAACDRSRAVTAGASFDDHSALESFRTFTLRFAVVHLLEETARHLGHVDVLRESLDGSTGE